MAGMQHVYFKLTSNLNILLAFNWKARKGPRARINNMHKRVNHKELEEEDRQEMDVEESEGSDDDGDGAQDQNSIANLVIRLLNKKVG